MNRSSPPPIALTVAGSDSGAGAGIQADLKTFAALGVYGTSALAALTAQNTRQVLAIHEVPERFLLAQIEAVASDLRPAAVKTGMLATASLVRTAAAALQRHRLRNLVVDPVMVSKSGAALLRPDAVRALRDRLVPLAAVLTPNLSEAEVLIGKRLRTLRDVEQAARLLRDMGAASVVIKGGHSTGEPADYFFDGRRRVLFQGERLRTRSDHGTGCAFSAAITAFLARGAEIASAVSEAKQYVREGMRSAVRLGSGRGPIDHFFGWRGKD
jgi:hydroxymethylpyrimidine/phosphomethylpyrimidine kinase